MTENSNRAFMYGESVFTTMRVQEGVIQDWEHHLDRLKKGVEFVYGPFTEGDEWSSMLRNRLETRLQGIDGDKVVRIALYREQARGLLRSSLISVTDLRINVIQSVLDKSRFEERMLKLRSCPAPRRPLWWPSFLKCGNYLETILAQKIYMKAGDDDILFVSHEDTIFESSVANIFIVRNNKLYTAPLGPNVLEGVMRKKVLHLAPHFFDEVYETETTLEQVYRADAVFGSNSVRGLFLVDRIDDYEITYNQEFLKKFEEFKIKVLL